jgi:hypothetical protein
MDTVPLIRPSTAHGRAIHTAPPSMTSSSTSPTRSSSSLAMRSASYALMNGVAVRPQSARVRSHGNSYHAYGVVDSRSL